MAVIPILSYIGGWEQGDPHVLYFPVIALGTSTPPTGYWDRVVSNYTTWYESYPLLLDFDATVFVVDASYTEGLPYTHVEVIPTVNTPVYYYVSEHAYIKVERNSSNVQLIPRAYYNDNVEVSGLTSFGAYGSPCINTIFSYCADKTVFMSYINKIGKDSYGRQSYSDYTYPSDTLDRWEAFFADAHQPPEPPTDPYAGGGTSNTGGGNGTFDGTTAAVDFPSGTPTAGSGASGFIKLFNPSAAELTSLAAYLWGSFDISSFKSIYNNPIDCIVALVVVPVTPTTGSAAAISLGNIATTVSANVITNQFAVLDCGSININEYWGAYLDYDPYTKCEIYLPYIGVQDIDINDIQGKTIQLKYYIDVLSGACVAMLKAGSDVLYNWSGQCAAEVPITSTGFGSVFQSALSVGNAIGETLAAALAGIPQNVAQVATSVFNGARSKVHKSGSIGSMAGHMGIQKPYLIITRPVQSVPEDLNNITGYPSNITATLGDLTGYTEVDTVHLEGIPATSEEMAEIEELLKGGVFI